MSPTPVRLTRLRLIALRLASRQALTVIELAATAQISSRQAHRWIALLLAEQAIAPLGPDPEQRMGRPRMVYGSTGDR